MPLSVLRIGVRLLLSGGDLVSTHRPVRSALRLRGTRLQDFHSGRDTQHSHRHLLNPSPSPAPLTSSSRPFLSATPPTAFSPATRFSTSSSTSASHSSRHDFRPSTPLPLDVSAHLPPPSPRSRSFPPDSRGHPPPRSLGPHFPRPLAAVRPPDPGAGHLLPPPWSPRRPGGAPLGAPAPPGVSSLRVAEPRGSPQAHSRAAAPPLPDPPTRPPSGVAANRVPLPGPPWNQSAGSGGLAGVFGERAWDCAGRKEGGSVRGGSAHGWRSGPSARPPGDKSRGFPLGHFPQSSPVKVGV